MDEFMRAKGVSGYGFSRTFHTDFHQDLMYGAVGGGGWAGQEQSRAVLGMAILVTEVQPGTVTALTETGDRVPAT
jgi:hypothetical protein